MRLIIDGDACPVKDIVYRAAQREGVPVIIVSNKPLMFGREPGVHAIVVPEGPDVADRRIIEEARDGDVVVTADIELAAGAIAKGALSIDPRGDVLDAGNVGERMSMLTFHRELRASGLEIGGPKPYGPRNRSAFAAALERVLRKRPAEGASS